MTTQTQDLATVWSRVLDSLADEASPQAGAFLKLTRPVGVVEDTALLAAPNEFTKDLIESRLRPQVTEVLSRELGREVRIAVTVEPELSDELPPSDDDELDAETLAADAIRLPEIDENATWNRWSGSALRLRFTSQPQVHLRHLRHRRQQPVRPRSSHRRRRSARQGVQPAVHLRRLRSGQDPPAARHRSLCAQPLCRHSSALRQL